ETLSFSYGLLLFLVTLVFVFIPGIFLGGHYPLFFDRITHQSGPGSPHRGRLYFWLSFGGLLAILFIPLAIFPYFEFRTIFHFLAILHFALALWAMLRRNSLPLDDAADTLSLQNNMN